MDYQEIILTFSKVGWVHHSGYFKHSLKWGLILTPTEQVDADMLVIERFMGKDGCSRYYINFKFDGVDKYEGKDLNDIKLTKKLCEIIMIINDNSEIESLLEEI